MKVSKTVSIDIDLLQRVLEVNPKFSEITSLALENFLLFQKQSEEGNMIHFSRSFTFTQSPEIVWKHMTFESIVEYIDMITKVEYITEHCNGLGAKCKLFGKLGDIEASSVTEIVEYEEYEKIVYRSIGDFDLFSHAVISTRGSKTELMLIIVIGLSPALASDDLRKSIYSSLGDFFDDFNEDVSQSN